MAIPSLRQLSYLVALEKEQSFSRAAESLHVTQSTLSAGIKELENLLGQPVVDRTQRRVHLTPLGSEVAEEARDLLNRAERISERAKQLSEPMSGPMRLGVIPTIAPYLLPQILPQITAAFPKLEIQLHEDLTGRLLEKINNGELDILLMAFPWSTPGLEQHILYKEPFKLACPKDWNITNKKKISTADLQTENLLLLEDGHCLRNHALDACHLQSLSNRKTYSATSLPTLMEMVRHGYGVTLLPKMAAGGLAAHKDIRIIPFKEPKPTRDIGLAWRRGSAGKDDFLNLAGLFKKTHKG